MRANMGCERRQLRPGLDETPDILPRREYTMFLSKALTCSVGSKETTRGGAGKVLGGSPTGYLNMRTRAPSQTPKQSVA